MTTPRWPLALWLLLSHLAVGCCAVVVLLSTGVFDQDLRWQTRNALEAQAQAWALNLADEAMQHGRSLPEVARRAEPRLTEARKRTLAGLQIVDRHGTIVASAGTPTDRSIADAPEVAAALAGKVGEYARPRANARPRDASLVGPSRFGRVRLFVAVPIVVDEQVVGAVVASRTPRAQVQALARVGSPLLVRVVFIVGFAIVLAFAAAHYGGRSLKALAQGATAIASGAQRSLEVDRATASRVAEVATLCEAVRQMSQRLARRKEEAEGFAGNAAHELRTPLSTLRGTLELLAEEPTMPTGQRERFLTNATAELDRLDALIGGLLALGRARHLQSREELELDPLLARCAARYGVSVRGRAGRVRADRAALETIILNLLENARRYGGPTVVLEAWQDDEWTGFSVLDDGPGLDAHTLGRVFDRFYTTDRDRGVGLGLSVVRELVEVHEGTITAHSRPGRTTFEVTLRHVPSSWRPSPNHDFSG